MSIYGQPIVNGHGSQANGRSLVPRVRNDEEMARDNAGQLDADEPRSRPPARRFTLRAMHEQFPSLYPPVIDGIAREGQTTNIISTSKRGKSWLAHHLAICVATGRPWLGRFATAAGRVALLDYELQNPDIPFRLRSVGDAMGVPYDEYADAIDIFPLRDDPRDIFDMRPLFEASPGEFRLIIIDPKYSAMPDGSSENDNSAEKGFFREVNRLASVTRSAIVLIHHTSKGGQAEKRVTDVGSGAGAQSRAADAHVILREHEQDDAVVLDAAVRSFQPVSPIVLRWEFPVWVVDDELDPAGLKGKLSGGEQRQRSRDDETDNAILAECQTWRSRTELEHDTGFRAGRLDRAIARLRKGKLLERSSETRRGNKCDVFRRTIHAGGEP